MARPKELTKADKFFLDAHINDENYEELAQSVKNTQEVVKAYLEQTRQVAKMDAGSVMITKTANGKKRGVAIMSKAASEIGDAARKLQKPATNNPNFIHECAPKDE